MDFIILSLAVWRISSLIVKEDGPFFIFDRFRKHLGIDEFGQTPDRFLPQLFSCIWCASLWVGTCFSIAYFLYPIIPLVIAFPFSLSAVAVLIEVKLSGRQY